jgi:hypothetical protein
MRKIKRSNEKKKTWREKKSFEMLLERRKKLEKRS